MRVNCKICGRETDILPWQNHLCYTCREREWDEKTKEEMQSGETTETSCEDKIYCPWCGEIYEPYDEYELEYVDGVYEVTCNHCEKPFKVTTNVSVTYDTERIERSNENAE